MVRDFAERIGAVQDGGGRRVHAGAIPNIGGIAILGGFLVALLLGSMVQPALLDQYRVELLATVLGGSLMALVGFMDDMWDIPPTMRLASQFVAAGILVVNGVKINYITNYFGQIGLFADSEYVYLAAVGDVVAVVVTLLWVVGFTNAFNFIDGLDGLSSGIAAISSLSLLAVALQFPDRGAAVLAPRRPSRLGARFLTAQLHPRQNLHGRLGRVHAGLHPGSGQRAGGAQSDRRRDGGSPHLSPRPAGREHHSGDAAALAARGESGAGAQRPPARPDPGPQRLAHSRYRVVAGDPGARHFGDDSLEYPPCSHVPDRRRDGAADWAGVLFEAC